MGVYNEMRARYLEESSSRFSDVSTDKREKFWNKVAIVEQAIGKRLEDGYTREDFQNLISQMNVSQIGTFYVGKNIIIQYLKWLQDAGHLPDLNLKELSSVTFECVERSDLVKGSYFKDFDSLQRSIDEAIEMADKPDDAVHALPITLIYLAWYGVTVNEATEIRKQDINEISKTIFIQSTGRTVEVSQKVIDYMAEFRDAESYLTQARYESRMPYKESYMLLRTPKAASITVQNIKNILSRFSKHCMGETRFLYSRIRHSGIYNRVYAEELVNGTLVKNDYDKLSEVFGETFKGYHDASDRLREYKSWKSMFYSAD